jgi:AraC-like DNA-binding protein
MFVVALHSPALQQLASGALAPFRRRLVACPQPLADLLSGGQPRLVVHDFAPEPERSVSWLDHAVPAESGTSIFVLLERRAADTLGLLLRTTHRFVISGLALAEEETVVSLRERIEHAVNRERFHDLADQITRFWGLDPLLGALASLAILRPLPCATEELLLHEAGVARKTFARHAQQAGFLPPLRFLHAVRVLAASFLLHQELTLERAARELGYGDVETLRSHFHEILDLAPHRAREFPLPALIARVRDRRGQPAEPDADPFQTRLELPLPARYRRPDRRGSRL